MKASEVVFAVEDIAFVKNLYLIRGYKLRRPIGNLTGKACKRFGPDKILMKLRKTKTCKRKHGSGCSATPGARRSMAETRRLRVKPGELATLPKGASRHCT